MAKQQMWACVIADIEDPEDWKRVAVAMEEAARTIEANASLYVPRVPGEPKDRATTKPQGKLEV